MCCGVCPKARANPPTDSGPDGMPCATSAFRAAMWRAFRMNDTVSLVPAGVVPKTGSPESAAAPMPCGTATLAFGRGRAAELTGPAAMNSSRVPAVPAASAAPARLGLAQSKGFNAGFLLGPWLGQRPGGPESDRDATEPQIGCGASRRETGGREANAATGAGGPGQH